MRLNISAWSIRRPIPGLVLFAVLMILGLLSFGSLPITRFPNIDVPIVSVQVTQAGAAPGELETQVTKKVEDAVAGVNGVKHMTSSIADGASTTNIEFRIEVGADRAINDVKDAISKIRADLPKSIDEPIVRRIEIEGGAIMSYAVSAPVTLGLAAGGQVEVVEGVAEGAAIIARAGSFLRAGDRVRVAPATAAEVK